MNRLGITFIFMALIISLLVTGLVYKFEKQKHHKEIEEVLKIQVLVATRALNRGDIIAASDVRWQTWPKAAVSPQFMVQGARRVDEVTGAYVRVPIDMGQPITDAMVVAKSHMSPLASIIKLGMRAFTIEMDKSNAVGGLLAPGDLVDVVVTYAETNPTTRDREFLGGTILKNILVVGVDEDISATGGTSSSSSSRGGNTTKNITLEVTPQQAEFLAVGKSMGTLYLSLANGVDDSNLATKQTLTSQAELLGGEQEDDGSQISEIHGDKEGQSEAPR